MISSLDSCELTLGFGEKCAFQQETRETGILISYQQLQCDLIFIDVSATEHHSLSLHHSNLVKWNCFLVCDKDSNHTSLRTRRCCPIAWPQAPVATSFQINYKEDKCKIRVLSHTGISRACHSHGASGSQGQHMFIQKCINISTTSESSGKC